MSSFVNLAKKISFAEKFIILLPLIYIISPLSLLGIRNLSALNQELTVVIFFYVVSQLFASLMTDNSLYALLGGSIKTLLILGLIGLGSTMDIRKISICMAAGLCFAILCAFIYSILIGQSILEQRLIHPYMTSTTLGIASAIIVMLAFFAELPRLSSGIQLLSRLILFSTGFVGIIASGSRGAIVCLVSGIVAVLLIKTDWKRIAYVSLFALIFIYTLYRSSLINFEVFGRLLSLSGSGREIIWDTTRQVIIENPLFGIGTYQLGKYLESQSECVLWVQKCPEWVSNIIIDTGKPWIIAHNASLQQISETGIIGFIGLALILGVVASSAVKSRNYMVISIIFGFFGASSIDNLLVVPSPFFGEIFWLFSGWSIANRQAITSMDIEKKPNQELLSFNYLSRIIFYIMRTLTAFSLGLLIVLSFLAPVILKYLFFIEDKYQDIAFYNIDINRKFGHPNRYLTSVDFSGSPGEYKILTFGCVDQCLIISDRNILISQNSNRSGLISIDGVSDINFNEFKIRIYRIDNSNQNPAPVGVYSYSLIGNKAPLE
ncbi:O-antigen ligase family protein [Deinococcus sp. LM3]|uniref:O-antigen ligase family protein n=1 Tax=Deinococcus sp. LM3 TaxID=1938608 RepID=UPI0009928FB0|nr:O-antigen ligase family protein [Deinococcus sp. LM3]